ncbi:AI-2E family transporter [Candidatus Nomurabacteria bacterium]|nr:AI-2E family transporter [Candidatus Nomurabacteria bacterium]
MPPRKTKLKFVNVQMIFFFGLLTILGVGFLYLLSPIAYPIFWAAVVAVMFYPLYRFVHRHIKIESLSSFITILAIIALVFLPLLLITTLTVHQSANLYYSVTRDGALFPDLNDVSQNLSSLPIIGRYASEAESYWIANSQSIAQQVSSSLYENLVSFTQTSLRFVIMFFIMVYTLYYFLKDGKKLLVRLMQLSPLGNAYEEKLYHRFVSTTRATLKSTLIVGGIQGAIGGLLFWITGIPGPLVWGVVMMVLSLIPAVGSFIIWLPAAAIMLAIGNTWEGITILVGGAFVISTIDNVLRPPLIGHDTQMHPLLIFLSTIGGLFLFKISGFIIGPIIAALFFSILTIYSDYYKKELESN